MSSACFSVTKFSTKRRDRGKSSRDTISMKCFIYISIKIWKHNWFSDDQGRRHDDVIGARAPIYK